MHSLLKRLEKLIKDVLYPHICPYCQKIIIDYDYACDKCKKELPKNGITQGVLGGYRSCSPLPYRKYYKHALFRFKFAKRKYLAKPFAYLMHKQILESYPDVDFDYITYVPIHKRTLNRRGFNQCELLARELSVLMGIPYVPTLIKVRNTKPQHKIALKDRYTNLKGAFKVIENETVKGKSILLVDDVITTGSTLGECAKTLQRSQPSHICCVTLLSVANLFY